MIPIMDLDKRVRQISVLVTESAADTTTATVQPTGLLPASADTSLVWEIDEVLMRHQGVIETAASADWKVLAQMFRNSWPTGTVPSLEDHLISTVLIHFSDAVPTGQSVVQGPFVWRAPPGVLVWEPAITLRVQSDATAIAWSTFFVIRYHLVRIRTTDLLALRALGG